MKGILITTYFFDGQSARELLVCEDGEVKEIMDGRIDLDLYSGNVLNFYENNCGIEIEFENKQIKYECIQEVNVI